MNRSFKHYLLLTIATAKSVNEFLKDCAQAIHAVKRY